MTAHNPAAPRMLPEPVPDGREGFAQSEAA